MADVNEGLEEVDVNSQTGFERALAARGLGPLEPESERADEDRFVPGQIPSPESPALSPAAPVAPPEEPPGQAAVEPEPVEPGVDPAVAAFLEQHGGDQQAALEALVRERDNAQSLIGRQGNELGDLRQEVAHLTGRLDELSQVASEPVPEPMTAELQASLETMFDEQGAPQAMAWLADNRPDMIEAGISVWAEQDPFQAGRFAARYDNFLQEEQANLAVAQESEQIDPVYENMYAREQFSMLTEAARAELNVDDNSWPIIREHVVPAFNDQATSPLIQNAIISPDPGTQLEGMKAIVQLAQGRAIAAATQAAEAQAQQEAAAEAEQRKQAATVISGSLQPVPEGKPLDEWTREERINAFKQSLLAPPSTSVMHGLTGLPGSNSN
jgi:hypothetical protein